jgi:archaeal cell division control protein 6
MGNIFNAKTETNILKDERFLYPDYLPELLPFRDRELSEMVFGLKPATCGQKPTNLFLTGPPGTGKTVCSKFVLNELSEFSDRSKTVYINCFELNSRVGILAKITNYFGYPVPNRGLASEEIFQRFVAVIRNKRIIPIIVFDEAEQLLKNEDTKDLLYDLSRLNEQAQLLIGLIFISNDNMFLSFLDDRIRSSLNASVLNFEKYTHQQLKQILTQRAKFAFMSNVLDEDVIGLCAANASKKGDARLAIDILLKSARFAEKENSQKVKVQHVRRAFEQEVPVKVEITSTLSEQEKLILGLLSKSDLNSGEIYQKLSKQFAERTLRQAITDLEEKKLVEIEKIQKGKGFTRIIRKK